MSHERSRPAGRQRGVAAVELAFVMMLLIVIVFGITELARAMYQYDALAKSARAAARYLAVYDASDSTVRDRAKCVAVYGNPDCSAVGVVPAVPGLTIANVSVPDPTTDPALHGVATGEGTIDLVKVTIGTPATPYLFVSFVPFVVPDIEFGPIAATMPQNFF